MIKPIALLSMVAVFALFGCGGSGETVLGIEDNPRARTANFVENPNTVDVEFDGSLVLNDSTFGAKTDYSIYRNGNRRTVVLDATSQGTLSDSTGLYELSHYYTTVLYNDGSDVKTAIVSDQHSGTAGKGQIRVLNFAGGTGNVNVYITPPSTPIVDVSPTVTGVAFGQVTSTVAPYKEFDHGTYELRVTASDSIVVLASTTVTLQDEDVKSYYLVRHNGTLELQAFDDKA